MATQPLTGILNALPSVVLAIHLPIIHADLRMQQSARRIQHSARRTPLSAYFFSYSAKDGCPYFANIRSTASMR